MTRDIRSWARGDRKRSVGFLPTFCFRHLWIAGQIDMETPFEATWLFLMRDSDPRRPPDAGVHRGFHLFRCRLDSPTETYHRRRNRHPAPRIDANSKGIELLTADLTNDQLEIALVMTSPDVRLIDDLSDDEDRALAAALDA
jgi:hypothetical protein